MIAFVEGKFEGVIEDKAIINVNGIGYNVMISNRTMETMPLLGNNVKLFTYTAVREDSISLYGFNSLDELDLFKKLISVNGIGPKGGLSLLSFTDADELKFAILNGDSKLISKAPGIGKKTAERVILDLKDKLEWNNDLINMEIKNASSEKINTGHLDGMAKEAVEALLALGYGSLEANKAVKNIDINSYDNVEDILKEALKFLL
ncbi:MAG: Holliday junction branch migration protein RuvA [Lachnospiraceae bacterium]|nr:Holliday junction branch migration protein RuvA [Lachnospiraceae bacterium]